MSLKKEHRPLAKLFTDGHCKNVDNLTNVTDDELKSKLKTEEDYVIAADSEELSENVIAFAVVGNDILLELQAGKEPTDYVIKNLQPSIPVFRTVPIQPFSYNQPSQCYSFVPVMLKNDIAPPLPQPAKLNVNLQNFDRNTMRRSPVVYHHQKISEETQTSISAPAPDIKESCRNNSLSSSFVTTDDRLAKWKEFDRNGNEYDKIKLTKLPCCTEHASEMVCISSKILPQRHYSSCVASETDSDQQHEGRYQNQLLRTSEEYEEVEHQLSAICFAKPEILTSSATLCSINTSKVGPLDDLLRRSCNVQNARSRFSTLDVENHNHVQKATLRKTRGRKPLKQMFSSHYTPRSPLPFEKIFNLASDPVVPTTAENAQTSLMDVEVGSKLMSTLGPISTLTTTTNSNDGAFTSFCSASNSTATHNNVRTKNDGPFCPSVKTTQNTENQVKLSDSSLLSKMKIAGSSLCKKSIKKSKLKKNAIATTSQGSAQTGPKRSLTLPLSSSTSMSPCSVATASKKIPNPISSDSKSPFDWLDTYFTHNPGNE